MIRYFSRWMGFLLLIGSVLASVATADGGIETFVLPNGMKVILMPVQSSRTAIVVRVGTGMLTPYEIGPNAGISHAQEHHVFLGTRMLPSHQLFEEEMKKLGAYDNASTNFERTMFDLVVPSENTVAAVKQIVDMLAEPALPPRDVKHENNAVREEIFRDLKNNPAFSLYMYALVLHADDARMHYLMTGSEQQIAQQTPEAARKFFEENYVAPNMVMTIVGGMPELAAFKDYLTKELSRFPYRPEPKRYSIRDEFKPKPAGVLPLYKVKMPQGTPRLLSIQWPLPRLGKTEAAAAILKKYLNREGAGAMLAPLVDNGLAYGYSFDINPYNDGVYLRLILQLTVSGEAKISEVLRHVASVTGAIAKNPPPEEVTGDVKESYKVKELGGSTLLDVAETLADAGARDGLNNLNQHPQTVMSVISKDLQELAAKLKPSEMELTLVTPSAKGEFDERINEKVEKVDLAPALTALIDAFQKGEAPIDNTTNPLLHPDEPYPHVTKSKAIYVLPISDANNATAILNIELTDAKMSPLLRTTAELAVEALKNDPKIQAILSKFDEAGIDVNFKLDPETMVLNVTVSGEPAGAARALDLILNLLKKAPITAPGLQKAIGLKTEALRTALTRGVSDQVRMLGLGTLFSRKARRTEGDIALIESITVEQANRMMDLGRRRFAVKGVMTGNWATATLDKVFFKLTPPEVKGVKPKFIVRKQNKENLPASAYQAPALIVRDVPVDHQGAARIIGVNVAKYGGDRWVDWNIFVKLLSDEVTNVLRSNFDDPGNPDAVVYNARAQFMSEQSGGSAAYMYGDSSHSAKELLDGFTEAMRRLLAPGGISPERYAYAFRDFVGEVNGQLAGPMGLNNRVHNGLDPNGIQQALQIASLERMLQTVSVDLATAKIIDSVAVGPNHPCNWVLTGNNGPVPPKK